MQDQYDFTAAQRGAVVAPTGKTRITLYLDDDVLASFRKRAGQLGKGYQTLINEALRGAIAPESAPVSADVLRQILREELHTA
jgi:uncharacterized protein (DUF4415 family)